jgi:hypothetical protein
MRTITIVFIFLGFCVLCFSDQSSAAQDFGIMMDVSGKVSIQRDGRNIPADLGLNILSDDTLNLSKNSSAVIVTYADCKEWILKGPDKIRVKSGEGPKSSSREIAPSRQLPVCYGPEEFKEGGSYVIGGFVLRGEPRDPLASLRKDFQNGKASNSTLMTLIMHDLRSGKTERAKQYFKVLNERAPESEFVKEIS